MADTRSDPAALEEAIPDADRGQGSRAADAKRAIGEAASEGVDLGGDADPVVTPATASPHDLSHPPTTPDDGDADATAPRSGTGEAD